MKKIPTLFVRIFDGRKNTGITREIAPGCEEAFLHGVPTIKHDGACCAIIDGVFYKRYDAKNGKKPPEGALPCCDPDPITGHWPHWVKVDHNRPEDKWFCEAYRNTLNAASGLFGCLEEGTYEAVGPHFQGNPYKFRGDVLFKHGLNVVKIERTFDGVKQWLELNEDHEGLVFWLRGKPVCKIKRSDFGLPWNNKK